jgi:predicted transcriptional regulator
MKERKLGPRITISLDEESYQELNKIAGRHEVSVSWLARYAIGGFLQQCRSGEKIELATIKQDKAQ